MNQSKHFNGPIRDKPNICIMKKALITAFRDTALESRVVKVTSHYGKQEKLP